MTHPFHPLSGREFELVDQRRAWNEDRVYFQDDELRLRSIPTIYTDAAGADPFVAMAAGKCPFRLEDLLRLAELLEGLLG